jgi:dihydroxy-acid dehydratase
VDLSLPDFDRLSRQTPFLANVKPSGEYVMEDFFYAGGLPAVMREILPLLDGAAFTVTGRTLADNLGGVEPGDRRVVRALDQPLHPEGGTAILYGTLAPDGAVIKQTAASPRLLKHRGRALVFSTFDELKAGIDDPALDVDENTVVVLQNAGPKGGPGMPEWGHLPIPAKLLKQGVSDMVRISDARMSGTSFGTDVLHVAPEAAAGGPLALVRTGDEILLDVDARRLDLCVPEEELQRRRAAWRPREPHYARGYGKLFLDHVTQANLGCDFDFLIGRSPGA